MRKYIFRPWLAESIVLFLVLAQEVARLFALHSNLPLSFGSGFHRFYNLGLGNFVHGYVMAFVLDLAINLIFKKDSEEQEEQIISLAGFGLSRFICAIVSVALSALAVVMFEAEPISVAPEMDRIPAGLAGSLLYLIIRLMALHFQERNPDRPS
ncbi:MAG: hypothetical protein LWW85_11825 [Marinilabiliales bacterium]|nr:hypothetical protein [Marinilabiliales bacterium]